MKTSSAPDGRLMSDLIWYPGCVAKGFIAEPPDTRNATGEFLTQQQAALRIFLGSIQQSQSVQIHWTCDSNHTDILDFYDQETEKRATHPLIRKWRNERSLRYRERQKARSLKREKLIIFPSFRIPAYPSSFKSKGALRQHYANLIAMLKHEFSQYNNTLQTIFGQNTNILPMDDLAHFKYLSEFLNPSFAHRTQTKFEDVFDPELSIQEQCFNSDLVGLDRGGLQAFTDWILGVPRDLLPKSSTEETELEASASHGFYLDGYYHGVLCLKRLPKKTYPGMMHRLTTLPMLDYHICIQLDPINVQGEIAKEQKQYDELSGHFSSKGRVQDATTLRRKHRKIEQLAEGEVLPFHFQMVIRTWDPSLTGLQGKMTTIKTAINKMNAAVAQETSVSTSAKKIFFSTWPGWTNTSYRPHFTYCEDINAADLIPWSSTPMGAPRPEALYDGSQLNLSGVRTFTEDQPMHCALFGMTGAGKSSLIVDLLAQTDPYFDYTAIIEEGYSYKPLVEALGHQCIILQPDGMLTINYFDSSGAPLTQLQLSTIVSLLATMAGTASSPEKQQIREAQLTKYVNATYESAWEQWTRDHPAETDQIRRLACAVDKYRGQMPPGTTFIEAYRILMDGIIAQNGQILEYLHSIPEQEITHFITNPATAIRVAQTGFAYFRPEDFPTHSALIEQLKYNRLSEHDKSEINHLADLLESWTYEGPYGRLFDGPTNINLSAKYTLFELSAIPESALVLKSACGLLINGFIRQHIYALPKTKRKRIIFEEIARFLDTPGGEKIVKEGYMQMRKMGCWCLSIMQQYATFKESRVRPAIMGNSSMFLIMRQLDTQDLVDLSRDIHLPRVTQANIQNYPIPKQMPAGRRYSSATFYNPSLIPAVNCTIRHIEPAKNLINEYVSATSPNRADNTNGRIDQTTLAAGSRL